MQQKSLMAQDKTLDQVLTQQIGLPLGTGGNIFESDNANDKNSSQQQTRGKQTFQKMLGLRGLSVNQPPNSSLGGGL